MDNQPINSEIEKFGVFQIDHFIVDKFWISILSKIRLYVLIDIKRMFVIL